jgi:dienelactone hydrolase
VLMAATNARAEPNLLLVEPVNDDIYAVYRDQFGYLKQDLQPQLLSTDQKPDWLEEKIHINSPYSEEGMDLLLMLPGDAVPPFQTMIFMPGSDVFSAGASLDGYDWDNYEPSVAAVLRSGRAVVLPVWQGAFSRGKRGPQGGSEEERLEWSRTRVLRWRQDLGTALDYLQTRDDINSEQIGYMGLSFGASVPLALLAVESRLKTAVLIAGGLTDFGHPLVQPKNHVSRITMPVLMLNGRFDQSFSLKGHQQPLFDLLGTAADHKKHVLYDAGHVGYPVSQERREIVNWLDTYLGPVGPQD